MKRLRYPAAALAGAVLGLLSKMGDAAVQGSMAGYLLWSFGLVSTGFLLWCVAGYGIAMHAETLREALGCELCFFGSMLCSYYLYSWLVMHYLNRRIVVFWSLMTAVVLLAAWLIRRFREQNWFRILSIAGVFLAAAVDVVLIQGLSLLPFLMELVLLGIIFRMIGAEHKTTP